MSAARLAIREMGFELATFRRDPMLLLAAVGLPLIYLVIFVGLFGSQPLDFEFPGQPGPLTAGQIQLGSFVSIAVISATFIVLLSQLVAERESGALKRLRGTPLPPAAFVGGLAAAALMLAIAVSALLVALGRFAYGLDVPVSGLPALTLAVVTGAVSFSCMGFAATVIVPRAQSAAPLAIGVTLVLFFLSGNFFLMDDWPTAIRITADVFPVAHLNEAMWTALNPNVEGPALEPADLGVVALWGLAGLAVALWRFRWLPWSER